MSTFLWFLETTLVWGIVPVALTIPPWIREMVDIRTIFAVTIKRLIFRMKIDFYQLGNSINLRS